MNWKMTLNSTNSLAVVSYAELVEIANPIIKLGWDCHIEYFEKGAWRVVFEKEMAEVKGK